MKTLLPAGQYLATLNVKDNILNVPSFSFAAQKGSLQVRPKFYYLLKNVSWLGMHY
jgi:translocation and assembly module TamB